MERDSQKASSPLLKKRTKKLLLPVAAEVAVGFVRRPFAVQVVLLAVTFATSASAQVSTDDKALDQLTPAPATQAAKPATPAKPPASSNRNHRRPTHSATPAASRLIAPKMPAVAPANPVILPPTFTMPAHAPAPPPLVPVVADAVGGALPIAGGGRITFGAGSSDLNQATFAAVQAVAKQAVANPTLIVAVTAWAPGTADDPSTARRLSLDRALAVRAIMIHDGVLSDRIRAVAKGSLDVGAGPADRADFTVEAPGKR